MTGLGSVVAADCFAWVAFSAAAGVAAAYLPASFLQAETWFTRIRPFERQGRFYRERLRIHRWKRLLPESNRLGPGRRPSKATLSGPNAIAVLLVETRRAEYVHLAIAATGPLFLIWNPPALGRFMVVFGLLFNLPFIAVQRYNRARVLRLRRRVAYGAHAR